MHYYQLERSMKKNWKHERYSAESHRTPRVDGFRWFPPEHCNSVLQHPSTRYRRTYTSLHALRHTKRAMRRAKSTLARGLCQITSWRGREWGPHYPASRRLGRGTNPVHFDQLARDLSIAGNPRVVCVAQATLVSNQFRRSCLNFSTTLHRSHQQNFYYEALGRWITRLDCNFRVFFRRKFGFTWVFCQNVQDVSAEFQHFLENRLLCRL